VQDAQEKIPAVTGAEWHMIGHLQTNKIKTALGLFQCMQSVDSVRLAKEIDQHLVSENRSYPVLLEVNISGEKQKFGFEPDDLYSAVDEIKLLTRLEVHGLMGIAPNTEDAGARRAAFKKLKGLFTVLKSMKSERFQMKTLSMGMSDDFEAAIEEGSNMIRVGRALFARAKK
jgi:PLP dependent protein